MSSDKVQYLLYKPNQNFEQHMQAILTYFGIHNAAAKDLVTIAEAVYCENLSKHTTLASSGLSLPPKKLFPHLREIAKIAHTGTFANINAFLMFDDDTTESHIQLQKDVEKLSDLIQKLSQQQHQGTTWIKNEDVDADIDQSLHLYFTNYRTFTAEDFTALITYFELSSEKRRSLNDFVRSYFLTCFKDTTTGLLSTAPVDGVHLIVQILEQKSHLRTSTNIQGLISNAISDYGTIPRRLCLLPKLTILFVLRRNYVRISTATLF
jgi:hypothetical protein